MSHELPRVRVHVKDLFWHGPTCTGPWSSHALAGRWTPPRGLGVTPRIQLSIFVTPTLAFSGDVIYYFLRGWVFVCCFAFCSCYASRLMSSSAFHLHVFQNLHPFGSSRFSPLSVRSPNILAHARGTSEILFYKWHKNVLGMGCNLSCGLIIV